MIRRPLVPWLIFATSLLLTAATTWAVADGARVRDEERFTSAVQSAYNRIAARLETYVALLRGGAGFFVASDEVTHAEFRAYVERLGLQERYPGVQGVGFSRRFAPDSRDSLVAALRRQGFPDFRVWPDTTVAERHAIVYLEPLDRRNRAAVGYDMFTEPTRRAAMAHARDTGLPALSGAVTLVQEIDERKQAGFLMYMPVYRSGDTPATEAARRALLEGFVYAPFRADDLFAGIFGTQERPRVAFRIYDGERADPDYLLHASATNGIEPAAGAAFGKPARLSFGGRTWTITFAPTPFFATESRDVLTQAIGLAGLLLSLVLFGLSWSQARAAAALRRSEEEQRRAKEAAEEANRMKSVFLANMSHEIRTPLTAMIGFADLLAQDLGEAHRPFAERIVQGGRRLNETLVSLLTLAQLEADRTEMHLQPLNVAAEVEDMAALFRREAQQKGLSLDVEVQPEARGTQAFLDRGGLSSVLQNLIGNAIKFTKTGGITIAVDLEPPPVGPAPGWVTIHVADTGIGIDPAFLSHLFEPFMQESSGHGRAYEGTGLGLAIAKQLTEKMEGMLSVESRKQQGSRFTLRFPRLEDRPVQTAATNDAAGPTRHADGLGRRRLLVVEDNSDTRLLMARLLADGADVETAANAADGLAAAHRASAKGRAFEAVLVDINLGDGPNGEEVLRALRATDAYAGAPIVAVTAYALPGDRERLLDAGFTAYLRKPFARQELTNLLARLLTPAPVSEG